MSARILLADDHRLVRHGLRMLLDSEHDFEVVAEASDGLQAVERATAGGVDLAILDVSMPRLSGLHAAAQIRERASHVRTLILSMYAHPSFLYEALKAGACGFVLKSSADQDLLHACRAALRGEPFLYPEALAELVGDITARSGTSSDQLTPRERQIVALIADAWTTNQIALELGISSRTVERHRENILAKLGMRDRVQLTRYAIRWGLVEP